MKSKEFVETYPLTSAALFFAAGFGLTTGNLGKLALAQLAPRVGPAGVLLSAGSVVLPKMIKEAARGAMRDRFRRAGGSRSGGRG